jgi:hypothetical protein
MRYYTSVVSLVQIDRRERIREEEEGGREVVRRRMGREGGRGSEEEDGDNLTNLTLKVFTMRYYTSVVSLVQIDRRL